MSRRAARRWTLRRRHEAAERLAALAQVLDLGAVVGGAVERRLGDLVVGDRDAEAGAERAQLVLVQLLLLVGDVLAFAGLAEAVALDRAREDDGRLTLVLDGRLVGGVDLHRVVAAERQLLQLLVGQVLDHVEQPRIGAEEVLADVGAATRRRTSGTAPSTISPMRLTSRPSWSFASSGSQSLPQMHLDDVPAGAAEDRLELLDDLAVAAHRAVEPLQVAVDDEDQVVELLARRRA